MDEKECCYNGGNKHKFIPVYEDDDYLVSNDWCGAPKKYGLKKILKGELCEWCGKSRTFYL